MPTPPVKSGYISNGPDLQLNYLEWGPPDAQPILMIIGLTGVAYNWRETAEALEDRYRCIALNLRGHGDSGPTPDREFSFDSWDSDVHALVTQLELEKPIVMGHSLGGRVAFVYAAKHPDHTRGVVVVDVGPGFPVDAANNVQKNFMGKRPTGFQSWADGVAWMRAQRKPIVTDAMIQARAPYNFRQLPDGTVTFKHDPLLRDEWLGDKPPPRAQAHTWLWQELGAVHCPMLIIKGEETPFLTHQLCDEMCDFTKGEARWAEIPNTAHTVMDDNLPGFLEEVEPFLRKCADH